MERIEQAIGGEEAQGALGSALDPNEELAELIATNFGEDREGAVQAQIKRIARAARRGVHAPAGSAEDERNPLQPLLATLRSWAARAPGGPGLAR